MPRSWRWPALAAALALCLAAILRGSAGAQSPWVLTPFEDARRSGALHADVTESSGVVAGRSQPGILWTINDSHGSPTLFATDTLGDDRGSFTLDGARNVDWEAITSGPCGARSCLYVADAGDNEEKRESVQLYRFAEPGSKAPTRTISEVERLEVRYPDGPRDVEAAFVDGKGDVHLISKGRTDGHRHYRVPADAWSGPSAIAQLVGVLPVDQGSIGRLVTDAALSPAGLVAVRTYQEIFLFHLTRNGTLQPTGIACTVGGMELQGEGIAWLDDGTLALTGEGVFAFPGTVSLGRCSGPDGVTESQKVRSSVAP